MISEIALWLIFVFPIVSFLLIGLVIRPFFRRHYQITGYITVLSITAAFVLSLWALLSVLSADSVEIGRQSLYWEPYSWLTVGTIEISVGIFLDPLTVIMITVVTGVSLMVQIYSLEYMKSDDGYARYFALMSLFTASMIGLVIASNIIQLFIFWELVGLCSYLLIGFWYQRPSAAAAAKKAFIVTRFGDFAFLLAILYLIFNADTFAIHNLNVLDITSINYMAKAGLLGTGVITWIAIGIFAGAIGKSGQFPLHTWLPDAMEGPTPVSSLIHAATMVAAGVFLVARFFPLFEASQLAMNIVAGVGGLTAIFAASIGLVMNDIKRVLAYSTISQLGYMMLALGVGAYTAAIFHLFTHAFFKCLLFMCAGNVHHATGTYDIRYMGGLRRVMPWTYGVFIIGALSLSGIFPFSGFWSKDEILSHLIGNSDLLANLMFWVALSAVFMTAFYIFRVLFITFEGNFRGGADADLEGDSHGIKVHLVESQKTMIAPMVVLAVFSLLIGFIVNSTVELGFISKHWLIHFLGGNAEHFNFPVAALSTLVAVSGISLAYLMYVRNLRFLKIFTRRLNFVYILLSRKYYLDELYEHILVAKLLYGGLAKILDWADRAIVDAIVRAIDRFGRKFGSVVAQFQTGQIQTYGMTISIGIIFILGIYLFLN